MHQYGVRDVEKLLRLPRSAIRAFVAAGFVSPQRGPRNAWLFSFQDLIVLRTAQALADSKVPHRRITRSVRELRRMLPDAMPLSGLSIGAEGDRVVVQEGGRRWQADSGQYLLAFDGDPADGSLSVIEPARSGPPPECGQDWFEHALALERGDGAAALKAYEQAIALDPMHLDARINLGRLLHESGQLARAERTYREAIKVGGLDPVLLFNLGVLLHDMGRKAEALDAYQKAAKRDPDFADCHYNLALLYEEMDRPKDAIRHMSQYRRLVKGQD